MESLHRLIQIEKTNKKPIYKETLAYYEITSIGVDDFEKIRKKIDRTFKKEFPNQEWSELLDYQKKAFILISMKDYMLRKTPIMSPKKIESKIESEIKKSFTTAGNKAKEYNEKLEELFDVDQSTKRRSYDDMMSAIYDESKEQQNEYFPKIEIMQTKIDTILKLLEDEFDYVIDTRSIEESLSYIHNSDRSEFDTLYTEYDKSLTLTQEEQVKLIEEDQKYIYYLEKLNKLDFIKYKGDEKK